MPTYLYQSNVVQYASVPVGGSSDSLWRANLVLAVPNVKSGDVLRATAQTNVFNDHQTWVEVVSTLTADTSIQGGAEPLHWLNNGTPPWGYRTSTIGQNIHQAFGHYLQASATMAIVAPTDYPQLVFAYWIRARAPGAPPAPNQIFVGTRPTSNEPQSIIQVELRR